MLHCEHILMPKYLNIINNQNLKIKEGCFIHCALHEVIIGQRIKLRLDVPFNKQGGYYQKSQHIYKRFYNSSWPNRFTDTGLSCAKE